MALTKATYRMIEGATANVKDFGAVGDGVADDTAAIQAAIEHVVGLNGGTVYFPKATYNVTGTLFKFHSRSSAINFVTVDLGGSTITHNPTVDGTHLFDLRIFANTNGPSDNTVASNFYYNCSIINGKVIGSANSGVGLYGINHYKCYWNIWIEGFKTQRTNGDTSCGIRYGGYLASSGVAISGSYRASNCQTNVVSCVVYDCAIGVAGYDDSSKYKECRIQKCQIVNMYFASGGFAHIESSLIYNTDASRTTKGQIILSGGDREISQNYILSSGIKDIGIRICQADNLLTPHIVEPAGSKTYCRSVNIHNNVFQEHNTADSASDYASILFTDESTLACQNAIITNNEFLAANTTAKPFGSLNDYSGNVPVAINANDSVRNLHYSHNEITGLPSNSVSVGSIPFIQVKSANSAGSWITSDDWTTETIEFAYERVGTSNLGVVTLPLANGSPNFVAQDNLMFLGFDLFFSERASAAFTTTFLKLYIDGVEQNTTLNASFPSFNLNNQGRKYTESSTYLGSAFRICPYAVQTSSPSASMEDKFIIAEKGQKITLQFDSINTNVVSNSGSDFWINCRTHWYNRTLNKPVTGI